MQLPTLAVPGNVRFAIMIQHRSESIDDVSNIDKWDWAVVLFREREQHLHTILFQLRLLAKLALEVHQTDLSEQILDLSKVVVSLSLAANLESAYCTLNSSAGAAARIFASFVIPLMKLLSLSLASFWAPTFDFAYTLILS